MARYDSLRKSNRNNMLKEYAMVHPELSLKEIGRVFNISGSRVCRILKGIRTEAPKKEQDNV